MQTIICLLRGINVSGHRPLKMAALKDMLTTMGFAEIQTYVQSGNVIFKSKLADLKELEQSIATQLEKTFGYTDIPVSCFNAEEWENILAENPFDKDPEKDSKFFHITFLNGVAEEKGKAALEAKKREGEELLCGDSVMYLYLPKGYGTSKLTNTFIESKLNVTATTRNWKTCNKLLEISLQPAKK